MASTTCQQSQGEEPQDGLEALALPAGGTPTLEFVLELQKRLLQASWHGVSATARVLPQLTLSKVLRAVTKLLKSEPTLLEITPSSSQQRVTVVGDTHGQYHDLCHLFEEFGQPSADRIYIFNGDFVDRGAWGVEVFTLLLCWKLLLPRNVFLLRGNHEGAWMTKAYGFMNELLAKYTGAVGKALYNEMKHVFACLPLAALVAGRTLILHGGLFRAPPKAVKGQPKPKTMEDVDGSRLGLGTLEDLRNAGKGGLDPDPDRSLAQLVASDCVWSDPSPHDGHRPNELRGVGTIFGPDVTQQFMALNGLRLIIRSHEGPDARRKRAPGEKMGSIDSGFAVDHERPSGSLVTLFSAPDYPQFLPEGEERHNNKGAVLHLTAPDYATPAVESFEAVLPRPQAVPFYDAMHMDSEPGDTDTEEMSSLGSPVHIHHHEEQQQQQQQQEQELAPQHGSGQAEGAAGTAEGASLVAALSATIAGGSAVQHASKRSKR